MILFSEGSLSVFGDSPAENPRTMPTDPITNLQVSISGLLELPDQLLPFPSALIPQPLPLSSSLLTNPSLQLNLSSCLTEIKLYNPSISLLLSQQLAKVAKATTFYSSMHPGTLLWRSAEESFYCQQECPNPVESGL